jgi:hypothetical protein
VDPLTAVTKEPMRTYPKIGVRISEILLPKAGIDLHKWGVIACDQFTSEPEYWQQVADIVADAPSTFHMILPEVYLDTQEEAVRLGSTQQAMHSYLERDLFSAYPGLILVERQAGARTRHGLMLTLDLEEYDFNKGSQTLIRATEGTILDRLPPRIKIRKGAALELPHILVLIDDPQRTVIEPLVAVKDQLQPVYDFELMLGSGHLRGTYVADLALEKQAVSALEALADPAHFQSKYQVGADKGVLLFAMGDGNHSLATAKAIWEESKSSVGMDHPARYALVEIENVHDEGLDFEPIHRVMFGVQEDFRTAMLRFYGGDFRYQPCSKAEMLRAVQRQPTHQHVIGVVEDQAFGVISLNHTKSNLPVGSLQAFLDEWLKSGKGGKIDYVHGTQVVEKHASQPGNLGFLLPAMPKNDLFRTVILDGALPRKTFSMGEAKEKRFYVESRKISP